MSKTLFNKWMVIPYDESLYKSLNKKDNTTNIIMDKTLNDQAKILHYNQIIAKRKDKEQTKPSVQPIIEKQHIESNDSVESMEYNTGMNESNNERDVLNESFHENEDNAIDNQAFLQINKIESNNKSTKESKFKPNKKNHKKIYIKVDENDIKDIEKLINLKKENKIIPLNANGPYSNTRLNSQKSHQSGSNSFKWFTYRNI